MTDQAVTPSTLVVAAPRPKREVVPVRHYGRAAFALFVLFVIVAGVYGLATNPNIEWSIVGDYLFNINVLRGLQKTLYMTLLATVLSLAIAVVIADEPPSATGQPLR